MSEVEYRAATQVGVDYGKRLIDLIVMPYEETTVVPYQGRLVEEVCHRGAFDGIETRANRVKVNRDHEVARTVGKAVAFHPDHEAGLHAQVRIAPTDLGDESLELAREEVLDVSAGFIPMPDGEHWEGRGRRHLTKVWLAHIALTPDPAYEGARVLSMRSRTGLEPAATPNLDEVRAWQLAQRYAALSH